MSLRSDSVYYYYLHNYVAVRPADGLVIILPIPLSIMPQMIPLYEVQTILVPVRNDDYVTVVRDVPKFFTYHPQKV